MTVPVIILDENDRPYEGEAKVELSLKNEGTQDLLNGTIEINENALSENIEVKKVSEGVTTNVLPQKINAGEEIEQSLSEESLRRSVQWKILI